MVVQTLLSIEMKTEEMILSGYNYMSWVDRRLMWDPAEYDGLEEIRLRSHQLWTPGIIFHNARDGQFGQAYQVNVGVRASGDIEWLPPALYKAACSINVKLFPFDKQKCRLIFRSTDYDATVFDFRKVNRDYIRITTSIGRAPTVGSLYRKLYGVKGHGENSEVSIALT